MGQPCSSDEVGIGQTISADFMISRSVMNQKNRELAVAWVTLRMPTMRLNDYFVAFRHRHGAW
jgi:hypothetical protein